MRFVDEAVPRQHRFSLGRDTKGDRPYLSISVANRMVDYEEYYRLDDSLHTRLLRDTDAAACFADECRRREHDDLLILPPGTDRGTAL